MYFWLSRQILPHRLKTGFVVQGHICQIHAAHVLLLQKDGQTNN